MFRCNSDNLDSVFPDTNIERAKNNESITNQSDFSHFDHIKKIQQVRKNSKNDFEKNNRDKKIDSVLSPWGFANSINNDQNKIGFKDRDNTINSLVGAIQEPTVALPPQ